MWLVLDVWQKVHKMKSILDCWPCLTTLSPDSFDFRDKAFGVRDNNESLTAVQSSRSYFALGGDAPLASLSASLVQLVPESMLTMEIFLVSRRPSPWQKVIVGSFDPFDLEVSVAWTAGKVMAHSFAVDVSASRLVDNLTSRQQMSARQQKQTLP